MLLVRFVRGAPRREAIKLAEESMDQQGVACTVLCAMEDGRGVWYASRPGECEQTLTIARTLTPLFCVP